MWKRITARKQSEKGALTRAVQSTRKPLVASAKWQRSRYSTATREEALKLTCKYWGAEVFWSGLLTVALADVAVRAVIGLVFLLVLKMPSLFNADEAVAGIAMVLVLRKVSINRSLAQAVQITMTTKTFSVVVGSFLVTMLLQLLH